MFTHVVTCTVTYARMYTHAHTPKGVLNGQDGVYLFSGCASGVPGRPGVLFKVTDVISGRVVCKYQEEGRMWYKRWQVLVDAGIL